MVGSSTLHVYPVAGAQGPRPLAQGALAHMGPMGPRGLGPWAQGPRGLGPNKNKDVPRRTKKIRKCTRRTKTYQQKQKPLLVALWTQLDFGRLTK